MDTLLFHFVLVNIVVKLIRVSLFHLWFKLSVEVFLCCTLRKRLQLDSKIDLTTNGLILEIFSLQYA